MNMHKTKLFYQNVLMSLVIASSIAVATNISAALPESKQLAGVQLKEIGSEKIISITANGPLAYETLQSSIPTEFRFKIYGIEQGLVATEHSFLFGGLNFSREEETNHLVATLVLTGEFGLHPEVRLGQNANVIEIVLTTLPPDIALPVLSNIQTTNISFTGAKISWKTNEMATSHVRYGVTASELDQLAEDVRLVTDPNVSLSGLNAGTRYYYQVVSVDVAGNTASSSIKNFTTAILKFGCNGTK